MLFAIYANFMFSTKTKKKKTRETNKNLNNSNCLRNLKKIAQKKKNYKPSGARTFNT